MSTTNQAGEPAQHATLTPRRIQAVREEVVYHATLHGLKREHGQLAAHFAEQALRHGESGSRAVEVGRESCRHIKDILGMPRAPEG